jgi:xanthine dehydrogenase accessory factor
MKNIIDIIDRWLKAGQGVALASVTQACGTSPRPVGSVMAATETGEVAGSVSGGCIEATAARAVMECLQHSQPALIRFNADDKAAWDAGRSCDGTIEVAFYTLDMQAYAAERRLLQDDCAYTRLVLTDPASEGRPGSDTGPDATAAANGTGSDNNRPEGRSGSAATGSTILIAGTSISYSPFADDVNAAVCAQLAAIPASTACGLLDIGSRTGRLRFSFARQRQRPQLLCVGGTHIAVSLTQLARPLGYSTTVIDPRGFFVSAERFPHVDTLLQEWPQQAFAHLGITSETAVCILSHDPKIDLPALKAALATDAFYVGLLGRPVTQKQRYQALCKDAEAMAQAGRVFGPIGLDLGGKQPEEIALAVFAEIMAVRYGRDGASHRMIEFADT